MPIAPKEHKSNHSWLIYITLLVFTVALISYILSEPTTLHSAKKTTPSFEQSQKGTQPEADITIKSTSGRSGSSENLRDIDDKLTATYSTLYGRLPESQAQALRESQHTWIKTRDLACGVTYQGHDREKWLGHIISNDSRKACVTKLTLARTQTLRQRLTRTTGASRDYRKTSPVQKASGPRKHQPGPTHGTLSQSEPKSTIYPSVRSTWGDQFNPANETSPGFFRAYYFNSRHPKQIIATEEVPDIAIQYPWSDFHGIKSEDFGAYWIGSKHFEADTSVEINVAMSWSKTRVIIDKQLVYEGGSNMRIPFTFSAGDHLIEVEYLNNWHTTDFTVSFLALHRRVQKSALRMHLSGQAFDGAKVLYASVYESKNRDLTTTVSIERTEQPVILVLSSYSAVKWQIATPYPVDIRAIAYGSYSPGTRVSGDIPESTKIIEFEGRLGTYRKKRQCNCVGGYFHCEGSSLKKTVDAVETATGKPMLGFAGRYAASTLTVPELKITPSVLAESMAHEQQIEQQRMECRQQGHPDFEQFME